MSQGSPPGYAEIVAAEDAGSQADANRVAAMPEEARTDILEYAADSDGRLGMPCCWFELETRSCRYYEYRPSFCRHGQEHPHFGHPVDDGTGDQDPWIYPGNANCVEWRETFVEEIEPATTAR